MSLMSRCAPTGSNPTPIESRALQRAISIEQHEIGLSVTSIETFALQRAVTINEVTTTTKRQ